MRKRWIILLSLLTISFASVVFYFIAFQFKPSKYKPKFRLTPSDSENDKPNSKESLALKKEILGSISKTSFIHLKGKIPDSLEIELFKMVEERSRTFVKVFNLCYVDIPGMKGYTQLFLNKLPVRKYSYKGTEQTGLLLDTPLEAVLIYFKEDKVDGPPLLVCPVISIDNEEYECYLRDSENNWFKHEFGDELDSTEDFAEKAGKGISDYYSNVYQNPGVSPEPEVVVDPDFLQFEISNKDDESDEIVKISEIKKLSVPGYKAYSHKFNNKTIITKYTYKGNEQNGLLVNTPLDAVLTYYKEDKLSDLPLVVCSVISTKTKEFQCFVADNDTWIRNYEIEQLKLNDKEFGSKLVQILTKHYSKHIQDEDMVQKQDIQESESEPGPIESEPGPIESEPGPIESEPEPQSPEPDPTQFTDTPSIAKSTDSDSQGNVLLDISRTEDDPNLDFVQVNEVTELNVDGYKGYAHTFDDPLAIAQYTSGDETQTGLPTDKKFEAVLTFFKDDKPEHPLVVCPVTSVDDLEFECYLKDKNGVWNKNDEISALDLDDEFGTKASEIVNKYYELDHSQE